MSNHTQGPWVWDSDGMLWGSSGCKVVIDTGANAEYFPGIGGGNFQHKTRVDAITSPDAKLIAAAPDLLDALKAWSVERCEADPLNPCLIGWNTGKPIRHWGGGKACRVCYARAVIARAEGR